ncbi:Uma2 family endonuclease [Paenibacillus sp. YN15]|nr:Uma2 family endonuclease [Paenibacillus sp. YN15]
MQMSMPPENKRYTYADYLTWPEGERVELVDGQVYAMTPAPNRIHQEILGRTFNMFLNFLKGRKGQAYVAPFDVRLPKGDERDDKTDTVVQPDLSVICDPSKLDDQGCRGAPDLVAEIISPSTLKYDLTVKKRLYERSGVKEYWMVYPLERIVMVYKLQDNGHYDDGEAYDKKGVIPVGIFPGWELALTDIFEA